MGNSTSLDLSIIIVSWNTSGELQNCLRTVVETATDSVEIILVDNASSDDSVAMVKKDFPAVRVIENDANYGFGKASNQGIAISRGRYVLLLNPDSEVIPGALRELVRFGDANPDVGIFGLKVLNSDGSLQYSCRRFPTFMAGIFRNSILRHFLPKNPYVKDYLMADLEHTSACEVDWVSGCAMVLRRELLEDIGVMDERFFMYCEDVDMGYRAKQNGWKVMYFPGAVVVHSKSKSSDKCPNRMIIEHHKSMYRFFHKHYLHEYSILFRMIVPLGLIMRATFFVARNHYYNARLARSRSCVCVEPSIRDADSLERGSGGKK